MKQNHPFHIVTKRPWPVIIAINILTILTGIVIWIHFKKSKLIIIGTLLTILTASLWWRDITRESTFQGNHTKKVIKIIKSRIILFIISEIIFFISFFWAFFHSRLSPSIEIGISWPPKSIKTFNPIEIPLLNTIILLSSGIRVTWSHHRIIANKIKKSNKAIIITIILGIYFSILQAWEYKEAPFTISDSIYGSVFFIATGFHGIHVIIGTTFLLTCLIRSKKIHFSKNHHLGFELAAWYWHFVDVVWLFLYLSIYWWGK